MPTLCYGNAIRHVKPINMRKNLKFSKEKGPYGEGGFGGGWS